MGEWLGMVGGKDLGLIISSFKKYVESIHKLEFDDYLTETHKDVLKSYFMLWYRGEYLINQGENFHVDNSPKTDRIES